MLGAREPTRSRALPLATRRGTPIPNEKRMEQPPVRLKAAMEIFTAAHPSARLRSATGVYNCMGLVFASRRTWVDPDYLAMILREDEYCQTEGPPEVQEGDVVVYRAGHNNQVTHVGIVLKKEPEIATASWRITVMSQWGADGEYVHLLDDVPKLLGSPAEYWTDRRVGP